MLAACGDTTGYDPNKPAFPTIAPNPSAAKLPVGTPGPVPGAKVVMPLDEAPHNVITEWWYYTGHFNTADGHKYGFEYVIFQSMQSDLPAGYASHFAITDVTDNKFDFDQKQLLSNEQVKFGGNQGFNLDVSGWKIQGLNGTDHLQAQMTNNKYAIDLTLKDQKGIALHGGGEFSYGPTGASYYYSRPLMAVSGTLTVNNQPVTVTGQAWFDHQWGNFAPLGGGGWQWFSTQLDDQTEIMLYYLRDDKGNLIQAIGSYIPGCSSTNPCEPTSDKPTKVIELDESNFEIKPTSEWKSPATGITYPGSWHVSIKNKENVPNLELDYVPTVKNQELDTQASTSTIYWEGAVSVNGTSNSKPISGEGYVELTGFGNK